MLSKITSWRHSKIIAFVLAVAVFLTAFYGLAPVISLAEAIEPAQQATKNIWDGSKPTFSQAFGEQTGKGGSADTPYEITTGAQLYAAVHSNDDGFNKHFKIMNDIQLQTDENLELLRQFISDSKTNDSAVVPTGLNEWYTAPNTQVRFKGVLDGNFHTITGLYKSSPLSEPGYEYGIGFINDLTNASAVKNITFDAAYVTGKGYTGIIAGTVRGADNIVFEGCSVINSRVYNTASTTNNYHAIGGIVGVGYNVGNVLFDKCSVYNTTLKNNHGSYIGGIYGNSWSNNGRTPSDITNCVVDGYPVAAGGACKTYNNAYTNTPGSIDSYNGLTNATVLDDASIKGGTAYEAMGFIPSKGWIVSDENSCPMYVGVEKAKKSDYVAPIWNGNTTLALSSFTGTGEVGDPYLVSTGSELYTAVHRTYGSNEAIYVVLMNDIRLQSDEKLAELRQYISGELDTCPTGLNEWTSDGHTQFVGNLDGDFHTVTGVYKYTNTQKAVQYGVGFIDLLMKNAVVQNITLDGAYISGNYLTGGIAGCAYGSDAQTTLIGCTVKNSKIENRATTDSAHSAVGGLIGSGYNHKNETIVKNCVTINNTVTNAAIDENYNARRGGFFGDFFPNAQAVRPGYVITDSICVDDCISSKDGMNYAYSSSNYYATDAGAHPNTIILSDTHKGGTAYDEMGFYPSKGWIVEDENSYPIYVGVENAKKCDYVTPIWNGTRATTLSAGTGSATDPYLVTTGAELYTALQNTTEDKYFQITNDIDLANLPGRLWRSMTYSYLATPKSFTGVLNGNGHTIYNYYDPAGDDDYDNNPAKGIGLIPSATNARISNLHIREANMQSWSMTTAGVIVGIANGTVTIDGCSVKASQLDVGLQEMGGFIGEVAANGSATISDSVYIGGAITRVSENTTYIGSLIGRVADGASATIENAIANGYATVGVGTATETNTYAVGSDLDYESVAELKEALRAGNFELSTEFYYDYTSDNVPLLKNRLATQDKDIDGNEGAELDADDASALKNILLYGSDAQLTLSEGNNNGYNDLTGVDITDLVFLSK